MMRKISRCFALLLVLCLMLSLLACGYSAVPSTEEEARTVFCIDGTYNVPYEFYRFVYLAERDKAAATGQTADFATLDAAVRRECARVYAVLSLCKKNGLDPYSETVEKQIESKIVDVIENAETGYGTYDAYLKHIAENHMNDSVFRFYLRYTICEETLADVLHASSFVPEDDETILAYYMSDASVCATWIYLPYSNLENYSDSMRRELVARAKNADNEDFMRMTHEYYQPLYSDDELEDGFYFGKYQLSDEYQNLSDTAFALEVGETSDLIFAGEGAYIVRRLEKNLAYLQAEENASYLRECYLLDAFYRQLSEEQDRLLGVMQPTEVHATFSDETVR